MTDNEPLKPAELVRRNGLIPAINKRRLLWYRPAEPA